ncbi:MobF family relaxase, partial [Streptomyces rubiginosohelvolus]
YEEAQGHPPGERAAYALNRQAADQTRPPKRKVARSLSELRARWRASAIGKVGACVVYRLIERARAAAAAVWARVQPVVDVALAAVDITAVVYVMRGAFRHRHLLAEARRHLTHTLRGRPHEPGLDEQIVQAAIDGYTRPIGRMMTADLHALYPHHTEDQAVVRPLTRARAKSPYERARLASGALTARVHAIRRSRRLNSRFLPHTVAPVGPLPRSRLDRSEARAARPAKRAGPVLDTDVATVEETQRVIQTMAAKIQDGIRERTAARGPRSQPAPATPRQPDRTQQPGAQPAPGRSTPTTGGA